MSSDKIKAWLPILISLLTLITGGGWVQQYQKAQRERIEAERRISEEIRKENQRLVNEYLLPILTNLKDNKVIKDELDDNYLEPGWGVLESYLIKVQKEGIKSNTLMRNRINTIVENNNKILNLINGYEPYIITRSFREQADTFRNHAIRYNDRWKAIPEIIETKAFLPYALPFPLTFTAAVRKEINSRKSSNRTP